MRREMRQDPRRYKNYKLTRMWPEMWEKEVHVNKVKIPTQKGQNGGNLTKVPEITQLNHGKRTE